MFHLALVVATYGDYCRDANGIRLEPPRYLAEVTNKPNPKEYCLSLCKSDPRAAKATGCELSKTRTSLWCDVYYYNVARNPTVGNTEFCWILKDVDI